MAHGLDGLLEVMLCGLAGFSLVENHHEHIGNRLGQWLKCANLLAWREIAPDSGKVITYNAEENRYMLDVNEAMGFAPLAYIGAWKKTITL